IPRLTRADSGCDDDQGGGFEPFASCGEYGRRKGDELRQFPQLLGGGRQWELIFGSARPAEAQSVEPEDALQVSEQHLDLLSFATGDGVGLGLCSRERLREWSARSCVRARLGGT